MFPGTMNRNRFRLLLAALILFGVGALQPVYAGLKDNNLIEFSFGSYPNRSNKAMLWPPLVKIYQDGKVIHHGGNDNRFFVSQLDPQQLDSLKKRLANEKYLSKSRFIEMEGDLINYHGGVSYIRYLDGDNEILLVTDVKPTGGPWVQLTKDIWRSVPDDHKQVYYPATIGVQTWVDDCEYCNPNPPTWPFSQQVRLQPKLKTISNPEIIHYLFERLEGVFSFFVWEFKENKKRYAISLENAPGWFEQDHINAALAKLRKSGPRVTER